MIYGEHSESSKHGIITLQCVDKMLSNNTFLETRIERLLNGLIFFEKGTRRARAAQAENEKGLYTG